MNRRLSLLCAGLWAALLCLSASPGRALEPRNEFDRQVLVWAQECRDEVLAQMDALVASGRLNQGQLFDTFYVPVPGTYPQKFRTQYDKHFDVALQGILDKHRERSDRLLFVVVTDVNGYIPTHNSIYSKPLTGNREKDIVNNRTKRIFDDNTGRAASSSKKPYLLQKYSRDTGETLYDLSVPIVFKGRHWGAVRIGYK